MKSSFLRKLFTSGAFAAAVLSVQIASAQSLPPGVQDIVKLKQAGLSDDVILSQIKNSGATYNLSADQIIYLKNQGIGDAAIRALISGSGSAAAPAAPTPVTTTPPPPPVTDTAPPAAPVTAVPPPTAPPTDASSAPNLDAFRAQLSPYGQWVDVPGYGLCWQPTVALADPMWRPYLDSGHWSYTDAGWSWDSDYPWGNVAFHYGRWFRHDHVWTWAPGYDWAPAWVSWREADGYSGWAPLPPAAVFRPGLGLYFNGSLAVDVDFGLGPEDFTFVSYDHFWDHSLRPFFVPHDRVVVFFNHSHVLNGYRMDHGRFVVEGLGHDHMFAVTHHDVRFDHDVRGRVDARDRHDDSRDRRDHGGW